MKILIAADFAPRNRVNSLIENKKYYQIFSEVKSLTTKTDYSLVNLEAPIVYREANPISKTGPNLKCHGNTAEAIAYAGFKCVTLANNHFYDYGEDGVKNTLEACHIQGLDIIGGGRNIQEAEQILFKNICGKTIAFINFCENEWSIASNVSGGAAPLDIVRNCRNIREARKKSDYVIVIVHGGTEQYQLPTPRMKETYRFFVENGADAVINHHQHCFSGYEIYEGKPIFYGLGNFCFDINNPSDKLWNNGFVVLLDIHDGQIGFELLPYEQCGKDASVKFIDDKTEFNAEIDRLNGIIQDDVRLRESFCRMAKAKRGFLSFLEPFNGKYISILRNRKLFPTFLTERQKMLILEIFRCEAHRDVMFDLLEEKQNINK